MDLSASPHSDSHEDADEIARRASRAHASVAQAVYNSASTAEMVPGVLRAVGTAFGWHVGLLWAVETNDHLTCMEVWDVAGAEAAPIVDAVWSSRVRREEGVAGKAWHRKKPVSGPHLRRLPGTPYAALAAEAGFRASVAIPALQPTTDGSRVCAVLEFLISDPVDLRPAGVRDQLVAIGLQMGQALERQSLERELQERAEVAVQEEIVESLWLAQGALETGQLHRARRLIDETIEVAERIADE